MTNPVSACRICDHEDAHPVYKVREMKLGTRDTFDYFQCAHCGCLQISFVPENLGDYYPTGYFSFRPRHRLARNRFRACIDSSRVDHLLAGTSLLGFLVDRFAKPLNYIDWVKVVGGNRDIRILDVGCGTGNLLVRMRLGGFRCGTGLDPFLEEDLQYENGVQIYKNDLVTFSNGNKQRFDLIMFHHSYEHLPDPHENLQAAAYLVKDGGYILIRLPLADSYVWEKYRENWVNLDAPRHLFLHTNKSLKLLAEQSGLEIFDVRYDSVPNQFIGSELYCRDIAEKTVDPRTIFDRRTLKMFKKKTAELNQTRCGDMAAFFLRKKSSRYFLNGHSSSS